MLLSVHGVDVSCKGLSPGSQSQTAWNIPRLRVLYLAALACLCLLGMGREAAAQPVDIADVDPQAFGPMTITRLNTADNPFPRAPLITKTPTVPRRQDLTGDRRFTVLSQKKGAADQVYLLDALHAESFLNALSAPSERPVPHRPVAAAPFGFDAGVELFDESGLVPPDTHGASGGDYLVMVVNGWIAVYRKDGTPVSGAPDDVFFTGATAPTGVAVFDPKVLYDQDAERFVAVLLYVNFSAGNPASLLFLAYSEVNDPTTWTTVSFDTNYNDGATDYFLDYPGLAVDEEAIYLTGNWFNYPGTVYLNSFFYTIDKSSLYAGTFNSSNDVYFYDPATTTGVAGTGCEFTLQPAHVYGTAPAGNTGTYLASFAGCSDGVNAHMNVIRVDNPLGGTGVNFEQAYMNMGPLSVIGNLQPNAPQAGGSNRLATNDRRTLDAVLRDGQLYVTYTTAPGVSAPSDNGQATAVLALLDVSNPTASNWTTDDIVFLGGEDLGPGTFTYFPAVAVSQGEALVGFSYSSPALFGGTAYARVSLNGPSGTGTPGASEVSRAGDGYYPWTPIRWGDYSGTVLDPDGSYWVFNQFAKNTGSFVTWGTYISQVPSPLQVVELNANLRLEGPHAGAAMNTSLATDLPQSDPYGLGQSVASGFFSTGPGQQVVDWVWLQLRSGDPSTPPMAVEAERAALLLADGSVVDTDGTSAVAFSSVVPGPYYVAAGHRNHLAVLSSGTVDFSSGSGTWDFTTALSQAYTGGGAAMKTLSGSPTRFGLFAADANGDGNVTALDFNQYNAQTTAGAAGYLSADFNLDGGVTALDFNFYNMNTTAGASSQAPE